MCSLNLRLPPKPAIIDDIEASLWIPYTDSGNAFPLSPPSLLCVRACVPASVS